MRKNGRAWAAGSDLGGSSPFLAHIDSDLYDITGRLQEIDEGYFVMYNTAAGRYDVHHVDNKPDTFAFGGFPELDARTLRKCRETLTSRDPLRTMKARNAALDAQRDRDLKRNINSASRELARDVSLAVEKDELYDGYRRTHGGF